MKKIVLVAALAAVMVLGLAASAYAIGPAYVSWTDVVAHNQSVEGTTNVTPHKGYLTNTEKCAVCHSVHAAGWYKTNDASVDTSANTISAGVKPEDESSEVLLRGSVANACVYCHVTTDIGGKQIYTDAAGTANYYNGDTPYAHNGTPGHASCAECHSVHGANTIDGAVTSKILKSGDGTWSRTYQSEFVTDKGSIEASLDRDLQVTGFCTKCHGVYSNASEQVVSSDGYFNPPFTTGVKFYSNHPLKSAETTFSAQGASFTGTAAWVDSNYCRSCHNGGLVDQSAGIITNSFPHNTPNNAYFLVAGADANDPILNVMSGEEGYDGVCLRCHVNGDRSEGIGVSF